MNWVRICLFSAVGYAILVLMVFLLQRWMIYFPDPHRPAPGALSAMGLRYWPDESPAFRGFISTRPPISVRGTLIVFHGNAGSAWERHYFVRALEPMGFRVVLAEYPGYGGRPGEINEASLTEDARVTIRRAAAAFGGPVYLVGESMGCGVAAAAAASPDTVTAGLVLITPWDSLPDLAQTLYWYLPARWLTRDRFDNAGNLRGYKRPVAIAVAKEDQVIPNRHSMRLYRCLQTKKRLWIFEGAGHNSWPTHPRNPWWREAMDFVSASEKRL
jgi:uncharacterized protein